MSDKEKMKKAFQNLKAPEDTLERVMETMRRKELRENMRSGQSVRVGQSVRTKRLTARCGLRRSVLRSETMS